MVPETLGGSATDRQRSSVRLRSQSSLTAFLTSMLILASSAAVNAFSAKATGHMAPSSRFAASLKPSVAYLVLNFCAGWKKQTTSPSLAYAGIPYQVLGERAGALVLMIAWSRLAMARSGSAISAILASTSLSPSARSARAPRRASAFHSWTCSFIAACSSSVNPLDSLWVAVVVLDQDVGAAGRHRFMRRAVRPRAEKPSAQEWITVVNWRHELRQVAVATPSPAS